jgi:hypothetical protein
LKALDLTAAITNTQNFTFFMIVRSREHSCNFPKLTKVVSFPGPIINARNNPGALGMLRPRDPVDILSMHSNEDLPDDKKTALATN